MKKFISKIIVASIPIVIACGVVLYVILVSKENLSIYQAIELQKKDTDALYSCVVKYRDNVYKSVKAKSLQSDIIAVGTSRTMQIALGNLKDSVSFFNAGGAAINMDHFVPFLEQIEYTPKILIVGLDQYFFNDNWSDIDMPPSDLTYIEDNIFDLILPSSRMIFKNIITGEIPIPIPKSPHIGLDAILKQEGFREDGTRKYGSWETSPESGVDYQFQNTFHRINSGISRFEYGTQVSEQSKIKLQELISYCKKHQIKLIAFLPPYAPSIWTKMLQTGKYQYIEDLYGELKPLFTEPDNILFDFTDGLIGGSVDSEYVDGFHGSDLVYARMVQHMYKSDSNLKIVYTEE